MAGETALKRRRVGLACDSCRVLKAKCDGKRPTCGRCAGYGYACRWNENSHRSSVSETNRAKLHLLPVDDEVQRLKDAIGVYDTLIKGIRNNLSEEDRKVLEFGLSSIHLPGSSSRLAEGAATSASSPEQALAEQNSSSFSPSQRYLGEASDIRFFHAIELAFCQQSEPDRPGEQLPGARVDSYEQEGVHQQEPLDESHALLPQRTTANSFVDIYFSTIHIAYPFIWQPDFMETYESFWQSDSLDNFQGPWLSLLLTVFAIGACYEKMADPEEGNSSKRLSHQHQRYFDQAVAISQRHDSKHTIDHVCALLAQCFYLLATCQTDRCWTTLGMAVRVAQSIGLHVEEDQRAFQETDIATQETRRRVWYCIYVLDRLLALQLGRPPAISDEGFNIRLPSRVPDEGAQDGQSPSSQDAWVGSYFIVMINFSKIIGRVFASLYGPNKAVDAALILSAIDSLDLELSLWKSTLPRNLRFDLSHTFENSITFKRQRNMLAIKFYNLQALIHRPLLSPARFLESCPDPVAFYQAEHGRISLLKRKCVLAAQHTAKLLHNIEDKKSLVYGFPWWQMISCLICASSILLVASICMDLDGEDTKDIDWAGVDEDADVCLTVFQALSSNSNAARLARDMMQRLKETRFNSQVRTMAHPPNGSLLQIENRNDDIASTPATAAGTLQSTLSTQFNPLGTHQDSYDFMFQTMPYEVSEPVMWSAQFVNAAYNPFLSRPGTDFEG